MTTRHGRKWSSTSLPNSWLSIPPQAQAQAQLDWSPPHAVLDQELAALSGASVPIPLTPFSVPGDDLDGPH